MRHQKSQRKLIQERQRNIQEIHFPKFLTAWLYYQWHQQRDKYLKYQFISAEQEDVPETFSKLIIHVVVLQIVERYHYQVHAYYTCYITKLPYPKSHYKPLAHFPNTILIKQTQGIPLKPWRQLLQLHQSPQRHRFHNI